MKNYEQNFFAPSYKRHKQNTWWKQVFVYDIESLMN